MLSAELMGQPNHHSPQIVYIYLCTKQDKFKLLNPTLKLAVINNRAIKIKCLILMMCPQNKMSQNND